MKRDHGDSFLIDQVLVTSMAVFCYLITDKETREAVLVDPAGDFDRIFRQVEARRATVKWVVNTHWHFDHTSGNDHVMKRTGAPLLIHERDAERLRGLFNRLMSRVSGGASSPKPWRTLKDGDTISLGHGGLSVLHTPGHTEGSICLYFPGNCFTGDTLFAEGYGRTDLADGSERKIIRSIRETILTLPDDTVIWPGHHYGRFPKSTVAEQKKMYR